VGSHGSVGRGRARHANRLEVLASTPWSPIRLRSDGRANRARSEGNGLGFIVLCRQPIKMNYEIHGNTVPTFTCTYFLGHPTTLMWACHRSQGCSVPS
jgi:hypothetical protein